MKISHSLVKRTYLKSGSVQATAAVLRISRHQVNEILHNVFDKHYPNLAVAKEAKRRHFSKARYLKLHRSLRSLGRIADQLGLTPTQVRADFRDLGIPLLRGPPKSFPRVTKVARAWLYTQRIKRRRTLKSIGDECKVSRERVRQWCVIYNIPRVQNYRKRRMKVPSKLKLTQCLWAGTYIKAAKLCNVSLATFRRWCRERGIQRRVGYSSR